MNCVQVELKFRILFLLLRDKLSEEPWETHPRNKDQKQQLARPTYLRRIQKFHPSHFGRSLQ